MRDTLRLPRLDLPPAARRAAAAVAIAVVAVAAILAGLVFLGSVATDRAEEVAAAEATLDQLVARVRDRSPATARAERLLTADPFLTETSATLAVNALQRRVAALAGECGVALKTIGHDGSREVGFDGLTPVALRLEAQASITAIQKLLYRLETETPFVLVDELHLRPVDLKPSEREGGEVGRRLSVDLVVVGFRRRGEGGA